MSDVLRPGDPGSDPSSGSDPVTDSELIALVRAGDAEAYEELFLRHREVAIRYARRISDSERAEDLCAEAFTKILDLLQRGKGPDVAFRAYLLTTVRTSHLNTLRNGGREDLVPDHEPIGRMMPVLEDPDERFDRAAIYRAFSQLPERWQRALWLTAVEGLNHDEVSEHLGIKSNAVASLAFRARAGLRQAYLNEHLLDTRDPRCRTVVEQLPNFVRDRMSSRRKRAVQEHLDACADCTKAALELSEVDNRLGALLAPFALAGVAAGGAAVAAPASGFVALLKGLPSMVGAKAVAVGAVAVVGIAVGAQALHLSDSPAEPPGTEPATSRTTPVTRSLAPVATPSATRTRPVTVLAPAAEPVASRSPSARPSPAAPGTSAAPDPTPTPAATLSLGTLEVDHYQRNGARWERILVPVTGMPAGTTLTVTTNRTFQTVPATIAGTGWVCGKPRTSWMDGTVAASTRIVCRYSGSGNGSAPQFEYNVAQNARLVAELTAPAGYADPSAADNRVEHQLRA